MLRDNVTTVAFNLVNYNVDISGEKPFSGLLDVNKKFVYRLIQFVLRFGRFENFVKLLAKILMVRKVVLNCTL